MITSNLYQARNRHSQHHTPYFDSNSHATSGHRRLEYISKKAYSPLNIAISSVGLLAPILICLIWGLNKDTTEVRNSALICSALIVFAKFLYEVFVILGMNSYGLTFLLTMVGIVIISILFVKFFGLKSGWSATLFEFSVIVIFALTSTLLIGILKIFNSLILGWSLFIVIILAIWTLLFFFVLKKKFTLDDSKASADSETTNPMELDTSINSDQRVFGRNPNNPNNGSNQPNNNTGRFGGNGSGRQNQLRTPNEEKLDIMNTSLLKGYQALQDIKYQQQTDEIMKALKRQGY